MKTSLLFLFIICIYNKSYSQTTNDSISIVRLLEKESATWRSGDAAGHATCWAIKPYSKILVSTGDGSAYDIPPAAIANPAPGSMGKGGTSANSNYKMNITGNNAWVSHDEVSTDTNGVSTYSYEIRILEKIDGDWKLVGQSIHIYKPK